MNLWTETHKAAFGALYCSAHELATHVYKSLKKRHAVTKEHVEFDVRYAHVGKSESEFITPGWDPIQILVWKPSGMPDVAVFLSNALCGHREFFRFVVAPMSVTAVFVAFDERTSGTAVKFDYYGEDGSERRLDYGLNEDLNWTSHSTGEPQWFEDDSIFKFIDKPIIAEYSRAIGFDPCRDSVWTRADESWLIWDNQGGQRSRPGKNGVDIGGTRSGQNETTGIHDGTGTVNQYQGVEDFLRRRRKGDAAQ